MFNLLENKTKSFLKHNKAERTSTSYKEASRIGIIFTVEGKDKHQQIKDLIKKLENDGKEVSVICYLPKDKQNYEFLFDFFTDKDKTMWGNINSPEAIQFSEAKFDYLFYLDTDPNPLILNLLARSKAKCRLGKFWNNNEPYFELMIQNKGSVEGLIEGIYKYTSQLR